MRIEEDNSGFTIKFDDEGEFYDYEDGALNLLPDDVYNLSDEKIALSDLWDRVNATWEIESASSYLSRFSKAATKGWKGSKEELKEALEAIHEAG